MRMKAPKHGVRVRMYRQGLGDCFLLAFGTGKPEPFYMLIDCGVIVGQVQGRPDIKAVAQHIFDATGGRVDALVATHQHWDHLSGFVDAADVFGNMRIGELWFAWTENPKDAVANQLRDQRSRQEKALRAAAAHLNGGNAFGLALENVLGFLGADKARTTESALVNLRQWSKERYLRPDSPPLDLPGGARVYVLGPPRDETKIKRTDDRKTDPQTYRATQMMLDAQAEFLAAVLDPAARQNDDGTVRGPFDGRHEIRESNARYAEYRAKAFDAPNQWREISTDWLRGAAALALDMDNATNNTSLALAIELEPGGKVLLFPADAQVGNWLSWHDQTWKNKQDETVTMEDLLSRTVLYKVGHHCSHNATLRQKGLDLMTSDELIALAPLDRATADKKKWPMPWPKLKTALLEQTKGRILQVDDEQSPQQRKRPDNCPAQQWQTFQHVASASPDGMYFDVVLG